ncbi:MAG: sigma-70 family RNA polymerase sigma factor [Phycisphaeraceae bacterium]|nr:sigma-70 family RNA polymerase sigma factor [Phycisphaeraceae bacterium]
MTGPDGQPRVDVRTAHFGVGNAAWQRFYEMYSSPVYRVAMLRGLSAADAEDVVQQVMMVVLRHIGEFEYQTTRGRFRNWILRIAERKILDVYRKRRACGEVPLGGPSGLDESGDAGNRAQRRGENDRRDWDEQWRMQDLLFCLEEVAEDIAPRRMEAFRLYVLRGVPAAVVAKELGMTIGHVYVTRSQVLRMIRTRMAELAKKRDAATGDAEITDTFVEGDEEAQS